jgi:hypothetical protein
MILGRILARSRLLFATTEILPKGCGFPVQPGLTVGFGTIGDYRRGFARLRHAG